MRVDSAWVLAMVQPAVALLLRELRSLNVVRWLAVPQDGPTPLQVLVVPAVPV